MSKDSASATPGQRRSVPVAVVGPVEPLSPTAARLVKAAKAILAKQGLDALTLEAVAAKAGVNKAATRYHFGGKSGLIEAIVDEIVLQECASMSHDSAPAATLDERIESFIEGVRRMAVRPSTFGGFFEILPHALRHKALRARLVRLYEIWYESNLEWLGLDGDQSRRGGAHLVGMGTLAAAAVDGIAIQASIHGRDYDPEPTLDTLRYCLKAALEGH